VVTSVNLKETKEEDRPSERIMLNFGRIDFDYTLYKSDGSEGEGGVIQMGHCGEQGAVEAIRENGSSPWGMAVAVAARSEWRWCVIFMAAVSRSRN